jgi:hypothetical protein
MNENTNKKNIIKNSVKNNIKEKKEKNRWP